MQMQVTVPTSRPTQPGEPWVIRYSISDGSAVFPWRLPATPLLREVTVVCGNVSDYSGIGVVSFNPNPNPNQSSQSVVYAASTLDLTHSSS